MSSGSGFSGPAWQDCFAVWAGQPAQAQVQLPQPERRTLYHIVHATRTSNKKPPKKPKKPPKITNLKVSVFGAFLVFFVFYMNIVIRKSEYLFLKVNVERASANVVMNDCMNVCIVKEKLIIQKEWHKATKPLSIIDLKQHIFKIYFTLL
jgi:hypothetical protein